MKHKKQVQTCLNAGLGLIALNLRILRQWGYSPWWCIPKHNIKAQNWSWTWEALKWTDHNKFGLKYIGRPCFRSYRLLGSVFVNGVDKLPFCLTRLTTAPLRYGESGPNCHKHIWPFCGNCVAEVWELRAVTYSQLWPMRDRVLRYMSHLFQKHSLPAETIQLNPWSETLLKIALLSKNLPAF